MIRCGTYRIRCCIPHGRRFVSVNTVKAGVGYVSTSSMSKRDSFFFLLRLVGTKERDLDNHQWG
jgi:hypothetical protein